MKLKLLFTSAILSIFFMTSGSMGDGDKEKTKAMLGKWCNPYTYQKSGVMKGFELKKQGKGKPINVPALRYDSWEVKDGYFIIKGERTNPDGTKEEYLRSERIDVLSKDSVELIVKEDNPRVAFLYVRPEVAEKFYGKKDSKKDSKKKSDNKKNKKQ